MKEVAFIVNPGSELYDTYFRAQKEKENFHSKARAFFKRYGIDCKKYKQTTRLCVWFNPGNKTNFLPQLMKLDDKDGFSQFKLNSPVQKAWEKEVVLQTDCNLLTVQNLWFFGSISSGSYSLWDYKGKLYGYLSSNRGDIVLPKNITLIKLSEYYSIYEEAEENKF